MFKDFNQFNFEVIDITARGDLEMVINKNEVFFHHIIHKRHTLILYFCFDCLIYYQKGVSFSIFLFNNILFIGRLRRDCIIYLK